MDKKIMDFISSQMVSFYFAQGRQFPWRDPGMSPFGVLVAEVLLRQTRAETVARVWPKVIATFPSPARMARSRPGRLVDMVRPLGLANQRANALKAISSGLVTRFGGDVPSNKELLLSLPHVGLYTTAAVMVFAFSQREALLDTNTVRILSRLNGVSFGPDPRRDPRLEPLAQSYLPETHVKEYNYGLLDFAAAVCKAHKPLCNLCGLLTVCGFGQEALKQTS